MGQDPRCPWRDACAIDNGDAEIKIELDRVIISGVHRVLRVPLAALCLLDHGRMTARGVDGMTRYEDLPYRTCVGIMLINRDGLVFIGRRAGGIEHVDESHVWQMPQGGVDPGEGTWEAAKRELYEETSVSSVEKLAEVDD